MQGLFNALFFLSELVKQTKGDFGAELLAGEILPAVITVVYSYRDGSLHEAQTDAVMFF